MFLWVPEKTQGVLPFGTGHLRGHDLPQILGHHGVVKSPSPLDMMGARVRTPALQAVGRGATEPQFLRLSTVPTS